MGHFARAQVTTPSLIYLPRARRDGRLSLGPRTTRIRTQDPLVLGPVAITRIRDGFRFSEQRYLLCRMCCGLDTRLSNESHY